tara:strand:+ start:913 stop:1167 length:255 start_codon:yes stop_codon:yes gene_type:complete
MAWVSHHGMTRAAALSGFGQIAPKIWTDFVRRACGAEGQVPRMAQQRVILFFCPIHASSWNQISIRLPLAGPSAISAIAAGKFS